jgi:hypothetical protein
LTRPLVAVAVAAFAVHALQGALMPSPWLLPDELHAADAARASARSGSPSLWALVTWPLWAVGTEFGYEATKLLGAAAVAAAAVPSYALARVVAPPPAALIAAAAAVFAPVTVVASTAHPVAVAYPLATGGVYLVVTGALRKAAALGLAAVLVWPPLALPALALSVLAFVRQRPLRALAEWPAAAVVIAVPAALYAGFAGGRLGSDAFRRATDAWEGVPVAAGASLGALALGLALVPAVVAVATLVRRVERDAACRRLVEATIVGAFAILVVAALHGLGRAGGGTRADETALLFLLPPLLALAVAGVSRRDGRSLAVAAAVVGGGVLLLRETTERHVPSLALADVLGLHPYVYALAIVLVAANAVVAFRLLKRTNLGVALAIAAATVLIPSQLAAWDRARDTPDVPTSLGDVADGRRLTLLAEGVDVGLVYSLLFWAPTAAVADPPVNARGVVPETGAFDPPLPPGLVLDLVGTRVAGTPVLQTERGVVVDTGAVARAPETFQGVFPDRWSGGEAYYRRFAGAARPGVVLLTVSRAGWEGPSKRAQVVVSAKPIGGEPFAERITSIDSREERLVRIAVPPPPFEVKVAIGPTFSPSDYGQSDPRNLGAQLTFDYRPG